MILLQAPQVVADPRQQIVEIVVRRREAQATEAVVAAELEVREVKERDVVPGAPRRYLPIGRRSIAGLTMRRAGESFGI
ncbi:MAG: hypothetical protein GY719_17705 [bacterium]|nr:hypothetical protein [bacterium]